MTRRQLRRLTSENFNAEYESAFDKSIDTFKKVRKRIVMVWAVYAVFIIGFFGAIIYALIQGGLWLSRQ